MFFRTLQGIAAMNRSPLNCVASIAVILLLLLLQGAVLAQNQGGGGGGGGAAGNGGGGNGNGGVGGIRINADGLVEGSVTAAMNAREFQKRLDGFAAKSLSAELNQASELRKISLRDLDAEIDRVLKAGEPLPDSIRNLAGLTRIDFIFISTETSDVIVAGPAEGFAAQPDGRVVGTKSHRPVLCLDDLLVALRTSGGRATFGCSFDPEPGRLAKTQQLLRQNTTANSAAHAERGFLQIGSVLGNWNVTVFGVPKSSHIAASFVESDYSLKRLTTGDENPQVKGFKSYFSVMRPNADSMRRWWFSPRYDVIETNQQQTAWHLTGPRLQVSAQDEIVDANGNRQDAPSTHVSLEKYAQQFTEKIPALAEKVAAIAQLQNLVDILVTAAVIERSRTKKLLDWQPIVLNDEHRLPLQEFGIPAETPSIVKVRMAGSRTVLGLIAGGVSVTPLKILADTKTSENADALALPVRTNHNSIWWWDEVFSP
ncbi:MAG: DUF1598 domain-containing protein [Planctomycetota bacterium]|nr:DUF1598 domain-containing protein [Planctomycetota bacterium]